jgi:hypothetical protein
MLQRRNIQYLINFLTGNSLLVLRFASLITAWNAVHPEKLIVAQLVKTFPNFTVPSQEPPLVNASSSWVY